MKHILAAVLLTGIIGYLNADSPSTGSDVKMDAPWLHSDNTQTAEDEIAPGGTLLPVTEQIVDMGKVSPPSTLKRDKDIGESDNGQIMWGTDRQIHSGGSLTLGWVSMDHAESGDVAYVTILKHQAGTADTIYHYYSSDYITWSTHYHMYPNTGIYGDTILQQEVIIGPGTNPWIYTFFLSKSTSTQNSGGIYLRRIRADSSNFNWITIAQPGDSITHFGIDRDIAGNLYLVYRKQISTGWRIYRTRSQDEGLTWDSPISVSSGNRDWPVIATGAENKAYIVYMVDNELIRVGSYTNWSSPTFTDIEAGDNELEFQPTVAASRQQPAASQTAWIIYANDHNPNIDIHYTYTQDGGSSWATGTAWPPTNIGHDVWEMHHPWVHVSYDYTVDLNSAVVSVPSASWDSIVFAWASSSDPSTWNDRGVHNDHRATGEYGARVDIVNGMGGSGIVYRQFGSGNVWFDYWWNIGVKEIGKPNALSTYSVIPVRGGALVKFSLPYGKITKINVYSPSGRNLKSIEKYFKSGLNTYRVNLGTGVYFLKIDDQTAKIVTVK